MNHFNIVTIHNKSNEKKKKNKKWVKRGKTKKRKSFVCVCSLFFSLLVKAISDFMCGYAGTQMKHYLRMFYVLCTLSKQLPLIHIEVKDDEEEEKKNPSTHNIQTVSVCWDQYTKTESNWANLRISSIGLIAFVLLYFF